MRCIIVSQSAFTKVVVLLLVQVDNCKLFNSPGTEYYDCACSMELYLQTLFDQQDGGGLAPTPVL